MNKKLTIGLILAGFSFMLAGCYPGAYIEKRIKREKYFNQIRFDQDEANRNNSNINETMTHDRKSGVASDMKKMCNKDEMNNLVEREACYVDRLETINNRGERTTGAAFTDCYEGFAPSLECILAIEPLSVAMNPSLAPRM